MRMPMRRRANSRFGGRAVARRTCENITQAIERSLRERLAALRAIARVRLKFLAF